MLSSYSKRFRARASKGIGSWRKIVECLSLVGVAVNCAIIYYTSDSLKDIVGADKYSDVHKFMLIVMIEHIIIAFKFLIAILIKDKPEWVSQEEHL